MTHNGDALSRFRGILLKDVTSEQLDAVLGPTSLTPATADQLEQANLIADAITAQRTNAHGMPLPGSSEVATVTIDPLGEGYIQPAGTAVWEILHIRAAGMGGSATATISWTNGATDSEVNVGASIPAAGTNVELNGSISGRVLVTKTGYLKVRETVGNYGIQLIIAYHVVSL